MNPYFHITAPHTYMQLCHEWVSLKSYRTKDEQEYSGSLQCVLPGTVSIEVILCLTVLRFSNMKEVCKKKQKNIEESLEIIILGS